MTTYCGIDVSTHTGIAFVNSRSQVVAAEEIHFPKLIGMERCSAIAGRILELCAIHQPERILIEDYAFGGFAGSFIVSVEIGTIIRYFLKQEGYHWEVISPTKLKKYVTGKGNAGKDHMILEVFKKWDFEAATNNIADAVGLAMYCAAHHR